MQKRHGPVLLKGEKGLSKHTHGPVLLQGEKGLGKKRHGPVSANEGALIQTYIEAMWNEQKRSKKTITTIGKRLGEKGHGGPVLFKGKKGRGKKKA